MPLGNPSGPFLGTSTWLRELEQRAASVDQRLNLIVHNEFVVSSDSAMSTFGTGAVTFDTGLSGGVAHLSTGAVLSSYAQVSNAGGAAIVGNPGGESWYTQAKVRIVTTPTANSRFHCVGMCNAPGATDDWVALGLIGDVDTTYLAVLFAIGAVVVETHVLSVAVDTSGFHLYGLAYDVNSDTFYAFLDGVPVFELASPANLSPSPSFFYSYVINRLLTDFDMYVDHIATVIAQA